MAKLLHNINISNTGHPGLETRHILAVHAGVGRAWLYIRRKRCLAVSSIPRRQLAREGARAVVVAVNSVGVWSWVCLRSLRAAKALIEGLEEAVDTILVRRNVWDLAGMERQRDHVVVGAA